MNLFAIAGLVLGISSLLLALVVLLLGRTKLHRIWLFFNLAVSLWGFGCFSVGMTSNESTALFAWKIAHIGGLFISVFFYHMVCTFCGLN
jgi:energy-coupling factor transporter transmembrane protein EcfT